MKVSHKDFSAQMRKEGYERRSSYMDFIKSHGLNYASVFDDEDNVHILIDPDEREDYKNLEKLASLLGVDILEFYGLVQLEGDEPDNQHHYDNPIDNGLTTMEVKRFQREYEREHKSEHNTEDDAEKLVAEKNVKPIKNNKKPNGKNSKKKNESLTIKTLRNNKRDILEVTDASSIPSRTSTPIDMLATPDTRGLVQRSRRKVLRVENQIN